MVTIFKNILIKPQSDWVSKKNLTVDDICELIFKLVRIYCILLLSPDIYQRREQHIIYFQTFPSGVRFNQV